METDPPRVRQIKQKRLDILEKRLDRFKKAHENLAVIEAQLETIEDVTKYIHEQSLTMRNPEEVSFQLDTLIAEVEETQAAVTEIEEVFSRATSDLLGDIDTYDSSATDAAARDRLRT
jgi:3-dehydroquinate dehydratase